MTARGAVLVVVLAAAAAATAADRSKPPRPGPPRPLTLPSVRQSTLANGLAVWLVEQHEVPVVQVLLSIGSGAAQDPTGRVGAAAMTADMLDEGAGGRAALEIAEAVESLGAELHTGTAWDSSFVSLHVPTKRLEAALPILASVALSPDFPEAELKRLRDEALTSLLQARDEPGEIASSALARALFPKDHRYAASETGDVASLAALGADDLRTFHRRHFRPRNATLIVVGDVTPAVGTLLEQSFGAWKGGAEEPPVVVTTPKPVRNRAVWLVDRPGSPQSVVRVGRIGPDRRTADYHALEVMNTILGGSFTSRLNDNLRETHGYAYGAGSRFRYRRVGGIFLAAADVHTPTTAAAVREILKEIDGMGRPLPRADLDRGRNLLAMSYPEDFETTRQIASQLAGLAAYGLPQDTFAAYVPKILAVGSSDVARVARQYAGTRDMAIVIVGDRSVIEKPLQALKLGEIRHVTVEDILGPAPRLGPRE